MKNAFSQLASFAIIAGILPPDQLDQMANDDFMNPTIYLPKEDFEEPRPGQKTYFFNAAGKFNNNKMLRTECVFKCFAINDKNAIKKFNRYIYLNSKK